MSNESFPRTSETNTSTTLEKAQIYHDTLPKRYNLKAGYAEKPRTDEKPSEDAIIFDKSNGIFGVIDGMGGRANGEIAAQVARDAALNRLKSVVTLQPEDHVRSALDAMRIAVREQGKGGDAVGTVVKLYYDDEAETLRLSYSHVGDTRLFHYVAETGEVIAVTEDQSHGNIVRSSIGHDKGIDQVGTIDVKPGDRFLLCSDGVTGDWEHQFLTEEEFQEAFSQDTPEEIAARFIKVSKKSDDKSAVAFVVEDLEAESATVVKPAMNEAEQRYQERQAKKAKKQAQAERAAAAAAAIAAASPAAPSPEAQELARMVADLKKDMITDASAEDAEEEEHQPAFKFTDNRKWKRDAGDVSEVSTDAATNESATATEDNPSGRFDKSERYTKALESLTNADQEYAHGVAARRKLGIFARRKTRERLDEQNDAAAEAYFKQSDVFDEIQIEKWKANKPDITEEELATKLAAYHTAKQRLHSLHTQHEFREIKKFGKLSEWHDKASEWYAGLDRKQKIAVGIGAAGVLGVIGFAAGATLGAAGAAGMVGAKMYKTYAQGRAGIYAPSQRIDTLMSRAEDESGDTVLKTNETLRQESREALLRREKARTTEVDKINKRTKIMVLGSGALIGAGMVASHWDDLRNMMHGWFDGHQPARAAGPRMDIGPAQKAPEVVPPAPKAPEFSADAVRVDAGEGWYQTFSEMGVTNATEQANLLNKVGPELVRRGVAYQAANGEFRISRPGELSQEVLKYIQSSR